MKRLWWSANIIWAFLLGGVMVIIMARKADGAGVVQTPSLRIVSLLVLGAFAIFVCLCQFVWWLMIRRH